MEPRIICVDEPTTGQDKNEARRIMNIFQEYNKNGNTIIMITHDMPLAAEYTDRVITINQGDIIADGTPKEVFAERENLIETNIRPPQITQLGMGLREQANIEITDDMWLTTQDAYEDLVDMIPESSIVEFSSKDN